MMIEFGGMTWVEFLSEFNNKYFSKIVVDFKVSEFTNLKQGNMIILKYVRKFDQFS